MLIFAKESEEIMKKKHRKIWIGMNAIMLFLLVLSVVLMIVFQERYNLSMHGNILDLPRISYWCVFFAWVLYLASNLSVEHFLMKIGVSFVVMLILQFLIVVFWGRFEVKPQITDIYVKEIDQTLIVCEYDTLFDTDGYIFEPIGCGIVKENTTYSLVGKYPTMFETGYIKRWKNNKLVIEIPTHKGKQPIIIKTNIKK
ncbi:MAG: hypothetical protein ACOX1S_04320 [Anaerostipes sp.]|jgi:hypothetical protein